MAASVTKAREAVHHRYRNVGVGMASSAIPQGSLILLWAGEDAAVHTALVEALQSAEIPFFDKPPADEQLSPKVDVFRLDGGAHFGFEVSVLASRLAEAETVLEKLLDEEPVDMELPAEDESAPLASDANPTVLSAATSAVWSGTDESQAGFLSQALKENEIPVRVESHSNQSTLYVPPEEETLAREIIREIVEGAPPE